VLLNEEPDRTVKHSSTVNDYWLCKRLKC